MLHLVIVVRVPLCLVFLGGAQGRGAETMQIVVLPALPLEVRAQPATVTSRIESPSTSTCTQHPSKERQSPLGNCIPVDAISVATKAATP